ncbi:MAG: signal peptidase II, partial [Candidatus Eisenbacteria bacterium]
ALAGHPPVRVIGDLVRLTYTRNSGVAFGIGAGLPFPYWVFSVTAIVVISWLFARHRVRGLLRQVSLSLIMGGAIGNLIDRVRFGEVTDFVLLSWGRWQFPVFNVADSSVTVGVVLFALGWGQHAPTPAAVDAAPPTPLSAPHTDDEPRAPDHDPGLA